jgi:hypothetical protein
MVRHHVDALRRSLTMSASAAGVALAVVAPLLAVPASDTVAVSLAALLVGLLLAKLSRCVVLVPRRLPVRRSPDSAQPRTHVDGGITDPRHHPLRRRAPGMA